MSTGRIHQIIRALTKHYPSREIIPHFNTILGRLFFDSREPLWLVSQPFGLAPAMELDVSTRLQRKIYYFPKTGGKWWMTRPLTGFMAQQLVPGSIFLDIGANLGFFSLLATKLVGSDGAVMAFEPDPEMYESVERSARFNGFHNLHCFNIALSDENS